MKNIDVALVGYGSQGTRIASAVSAQRVIRIAGVCLKEPDLFARMAFVNKFPIYLVDSDYSKAFEESGITVQGSISDLLPNVDVVIDCTPSGVGKRNKERFYSKSDVKTVFQAGESYSIADVPVFVSNINYDKARGADSVRIPTAFTVSLARILEPLDHEFGVDHVACTLIRPGTEPMRGYSGPVDTIVADKPALVRFLADEIKHVFPRAMTFSSFAVPSMLLAVESLTIGLDKKAARKKIIDLLCGIERSILVRSEKGLSSTDSIFEYIRRIGRPSADIYEVCIWYEYVDVTDDRLKLVLVIDPHCTQTPEVIDAVRALIGKKTFAESCRLTNQALKILSLGVYP